MMAKKTQEQLQGDAAGHTCPHCGYLFSLTTLRGTVSYIGLPFEGMNVTLLCPGCNTISVIRVHVVVSYEIRKTAR